ncbi:HelD family protein [Pseudalkalibacillus salsuginis]|uniref:HelD family protein n=1 Tax=Pseudalkalibacillus salsuginis TaxID=2910972 RepID=UPI001F489B7F|nr:UvrD-helicase domain-containing protein [Pseudalkalibacillus salsuginis]MCF6411081.1 AAA family ATPase [Pseudalkalibacillus salsuginis]
MQSAFDVEKQQLEQIAAEVKSQIIKLEKIPRYFGEDITEQALDDRREQARKSLRIAKEEPFFGRLDFHAKGKPGPEEVYIGKVGVTEESTNDLMVIDWRAPVASLFYSYSGGEEDIYYIAPEGRVDGDIHLKRNVVIRNQKLQRVVDAYVKGSTETRGTDEFLLYRLGDKKDNRLRDIVSTIQAEQNHIIRADKNQPLIIQGVAGSGKTTVALHRLAYLLYHYRDHLSATQMIIFAPNRMFLDYISNVLPELGVGGIQQTTFDEWAQGILEEGITVSDRAGELESIFSKGLGINQHIREAGRLKGSLAYKKVLEDALDQFEKTMVPETDLKLWEGAVLPSSTVKKWNDEQRHFPISVRRKRIMNRLKTWAQNQVGEMLPHERKERKKTADRQLKAYMKEWPDHNAFTFYKELYKKTRLQSFALPIQGYLPRGVIDDTRKRMNKKEVTSEDLPALIWIHQRLFGMDKQGTYQHVVIDEAQDFSPFHINVLSLYVTEDSFTILGDISQGIHSYKGIEKWKEFIGVFGEGKSKYVQMKRSYRSTLEIIEYANRILQNMRHTVGLAKPVFRSGEPVREIQIGRTDRTGKLISIIEQIQKSDANSIALIGRTAKDCKEVHERLTEHGIGVSLITADQTNYQGGISVIPVYMTKGLEFDAAVVLDADPDHYQLNDSDAKLLYVGCTRALHQLWVLYEDELTPLVRTKLNL